MSRSIALVIFLLSQQRYAIMLQSVERVVNVVEITPLPNAPDLVPGVINVAGRILPVVDIRTRLRLPGRGVMLDDKLIIARMRERKVALLVDAVDGVIEAPNEQIVAGRQVLPGLPTVAGVVTLPDGLIVIHDLDRFLSLDEADALDEALLGA